MNKVIDIASTIEVITKEARDIGEAVDAVLEADEVADEEAREHAETLYRILFEDVEAGLAAVDSARALELAGLQRAKAIADHYARQAKEAERRLEVIDGFALRALKAAAEAAGQETIRIKGQRVNVGLVRTPPSVVVDVPAELLPRAFQRVKIEPDKKALGAALKRGEEVPGVHHESGVRVDWRGAR